MNGHDYNLSVARIGRVKTGKRGQKPVDELLEASKGNSIDFVVDDGLEVV